MTQNDCPFSGHTFDPLGAHLEDPHEILRAARAEHPVFYSERLGAWVLTRYEHIKFACANPAIFSSRETLHPVSPFDAGLFPILADGIGPIPSMINSDPPAEHARHRAPLSAALHRKRVACETESIRRIADTLIDGFPVHGEMDIMVRYAAPLPLRALLDQFGIPQEHAEQMRIWSDEAFALTASPFDISREDEKEQQQQCAQSLVDLQTYMQVLVEQRQCKPTSDLVSVLLSPEAQHDPAHPLAPVEVVASCVGVMIAGHKTTASLIGTALALLLDEPQRWQSVVAHPDTIPSVLEECLRYDATVPYFWRITTQQVEIGGTVIPAEALVVLAYASANRDEERFTDADRFDPDRARQTHMGFGYGIHFCVGEAGARLVAKVALEALAERVPEVRMVPQQELRHRETLQFRGYKRLLVVRRGLHRLRATSAADPFQR